MSQLPSDGKRLRACMLCSLIKSQADFRRHGCDNCEAVLRMKGSSDRVAECTSSLFQGCVAMMQPAASWVARWQHLGSYQRGLYALQVTGRLPEEVQVMLEQQGIPYRARDGLDV